MVMYPKWYAAHARWLQQPTEIIKPTQYSRNLETLTVAKLVNKLPVFYGPRIYEGSILILMSHP